MTKPTLKFDMPLAPLALQPERNLWRCGFVVADVSEAKALFMVDATVCLPRVDVGLGSQGEVTGFPREVRCSPNVRLTFQ
jgi:hypothetical protein